MTKASKELQKLISEGLNPPCEICGSDLYISSLQKGNTGSNGYSYRCTNQDCDLQPGFVYIPWYNVLFKAFQNKLVTILLLIISSVSISSIISIRFFKNNFINEQVKSKEQKQELSFEREFFKNFDSKDSENLLLNLALFAFNKTEDNSKQSYFLLIDLFKLITIDSPYEMKIKFIKSIAKHWNTYNNTAYIRPNDPGFYRHYLLAIIFYDISKNSEKDDRLYINAKEWSLIFFLRFFGNVNKTKWDSEEYSSTIRFAVIASKKYIKKLLDDLKFNKKYRLVILKLMSVNDFDGIFKIYKEGLHGLPPIINFLNKEKLNQETLWIN